MKRTTKKTPARRKGSSAAAVAPDNPTPQPTEDQAFFRDEAPYFDYFLEAIEYPACVADVQARLTREEFTALRDRLADIRGVDHPPKTVQSGSNPAMERMAADLTALNKAVSGAAGDPEKKLDTLDYEQRFLNTAQRIYRRERGMDSPFEEFLEQLVDYVGIHGRNPNPAQVRSLFNTFCENYEFNLESVKQFIRDNPTAGFEVGESTAAPAKKARENDSLDREQAVMNAAQRMYRNCSGDDAPLEDFVLQILSRYSWAGNGYKHLTPKDIYHLHEQYREKWQMVAETCQQFKAAYPDVDELMSEMEAADEQCAGGRTDD